MAGFITKRKDPRTYATTNRVSKMLRKISNLGMDFDGKVFKNSKAIGLYDVDPTTPNTQIFQYEDSIYDIFQGFSYTDPSMHKNVSIYDQRYDDRKRNELRRLAVQDEIEDILDIITDDAICYNKNGVFCELLYDKTLLSDELNEEINDIFNSIYSYFGFWDQNMAWGYFRKFLIEGFLAFEIIYDGEPNKPETQRNIINFKELDILSLIPAVSQETGEKIWIQYPNDPARQRVLFDSQVIYISYAQFDSASRVSYVERLSRAFNLLRIMEATRIMWAVTNSSYKTLFTIPVESYRNRGQQTLAQMMHNYKEIIDFNEESGELFVNGRPMMPFSKEYWFPSVGGESPSIQTIGNDGPDLSDTEALNYFKQKLWQTSKIPFTRFDNTQGRGSYALNTESMMREEVKFNNFVNRLRSIFKEMLIKPIYIQLCLKHKEFSTDVSFRNSLTLDFVSDNVFTEMREIEVLQKKSEFISAMMQNLVTQDSDGNDVPYFDLDFLVMRFSGLSQEDVESNKKYKERKKLEKEGYKDEDIEEILNGEPKSKFKAEKKEEKKDEGEEEEGGGFSL